MIAIAKVPPNGSEKSMRLMALARLLGQLPTTCRLLGMNRKPVPAPEMAIMTLTPTALRAFVAQAKTAKPVPSRSEPRNSG